MKIKTVYLLNKHYIYHKNIIISDVRRMDELTIFDKSFNGFESRLFKIYQEGVVDNDVLTLSTIETAEKKGLIADTIVIDPKLRGIEERTRSANKSIYDKIIKSRASLLLSDKKLHGAPSGIAIMKDGNSRLLKIDK